MQKNMIQKLLNNTTKLLYFMRRTNCDTVRQKVRLDTFLIELIGLFVKQFRPIILYLEVRALFVDYLIKSNCFIELFFAICTTRIDLWCHPGQNKPRVDDSIGLFYRKDIGIKQLSQLKKVCQENWEFLQWCCF